MKWLKEYEAPIGVLGMVTDGKALNALLLEKELEGVDREKQGWLEWDCMESRNKQEEAGRLCNKEEQYSNENNEARNAAEIFAVTEQWLDRYFDGERMGNPVLQAGEKQINSVKREYLICDEGSEKLILRPEGSEFQQEVWRILCEIPYGEVVTYGDIAQQMAKIRGKKKMSAQAVGGAVGHNPIAIMIPCHRVIGTGGNLVGYGGGMPAKVHLLKHEGHDMKRFTIPTKGTKL